MGLPAGTAGLKRHISITTEFAFRTISPVPSISRYVSKGLVSSVSPRIFPGRNAGGASPVPVIRGPTWTGTLDSTSCASAPKDSPALDIGHLARGSIPTLPLGYITLPSRFTARLRLTASRPPQPPRIPLGPPRPLSGSLVMYLGGDSRLLRDGFSKPFCIA